MKDLASIHENELDGALNALFLETYSRKEDEGVARFCLEQDYNVIIHPEKEKAILARLNGKEGGNKNRMLLLAGLLFVITAAFFFINRDKEKEQTVTVPSQTKNTFSNSNIADTNAVPAMPSISHEKKTGLKTPENPASSFVPSDQQMLPPLDSARPAAAYTDTPGPAPNQAEEQMLPYFNKDGLAFFAKIKERMLQKLVKIDDFLYAKTEPGATMYKSREVTVPPFVMSNFPVTNIQYKTFLADLASQGRIEDLKKCLPKGEVWKEYGCFALAKNYFENESYNDFPVVNIGKEACVLFCEWLEEEVNRQLEESVKISKTKVAGKKKQVVVRLPYDYEWIYSADAAYSLIPDCGGYNTIYDPSEGLVDKAFFKRTSERNKRSLRNENRMDKLSDVNRFGMTEGEMIAIFKEAISFTDKNNPALITDPASYPNNIEACCLAGHVCELIKDREGGMLVRGCCWKSKDDYLKMLETYKKFGASPFVGFRVLILNAERGTDKNPFW